MRDHLAYAKALLRHKKYVYLACRAIGLSALAGVLHDASKLLPTEWLPYVKAFYGPSGESHYVESDAFNYAWNHHQKSNRHHWQYWVLTQDDGPPIALPMPERYVREMVADWAGASLAYAGTVPLDAWYEQHRQIMNLHPKTQALIVQCLKQIMPWYLAMQVTK